MEGVKCGVQLREALRVEVRDLARAQADGVTSGLSKARSGPMPWQPFPGESRPSSTGSMPK